MQFRSMTGLHRATRFARSFGPIVPALIVKPTANAARPKREHLQKIVEFMESLGRAAR